MAEIDTFASERIDGRHQDLSDELDAEISRVRAAIQSLTKRKQLLTASLVSSTKVQSHLTSLNLSQAATQTPSDPSPLQLQAQHNQTNVHRLAYGVTSFPYVDPNPDTSDQPLLGVRFDIPSRNGSFEKAPYYVFLKKSHDANTSSPNNHNDNNLRIHHHTIPALIPLHDYEATYLPHPPSTAQPNHNRDNESYFNPSSPAPIDNNEEIDDPNNNNSSQPTQNLHGLINAVHQDLKSWHLRTESVSLLSEQLGLTASSSPSTSPQSFSVQTLQATAPDARFCRLVWRNGTVGRLRLTDDGYIDRAVVIGDRGRKSAGDVGRVKDLERILCTGKDGGRLAILDVIGRLEDVEKRMERMTREDSKSYDHHDNNDDNDVDDNMEVDEAPNDTALVET